MRTDAVFFIAAFVFVKLQPSEKHYEPHVDPPAISAPPIAGRVAASLLDNTHDVPHGIDAVVSAS